MTDFLLPQSPRAIAQYLHTLSGFNPEALGWPVFSKIIRQRMDACLIDDLEQYAQLLEGSDIERSALIEATIVPETWFFRDPGTFDALRQIVTDWRVGTNSTCLRILSLPCASGEEPYSIAITLREADLIPSQFRLDAIDISAIAVNKAIQAVYTDNSFRSATLDFRERYFRKNTRGYQLQDAIRDSVYLSTNNFFTLSYTRPYNIIFCRNLLIYFDKATRTRAFVQLHSMLTKDGLLFLGHAEAMQATYHGWINTNYANVFRKAPIAKLRNYLAYAQKPHPLATPPDRGGETDTHSISCPEKSQGGVAVVIK